MSMSGKHLYEFGPFLLYPEERLLERDRQPVPLPPKAFDTLLALVRNGGHLIPKDELMKSIWPDTFVEEVNLSQNVSLLRKVLGDTAQEQRYIVTVPGRGYRFAAEVREVDGKEDALLVETRSRTRVSVSETGVPESPAVPVPSRAHAWTWDRLLPVAIVVLAGALLAIGLAWRRQNHRPLGEMDTIVLGDFDNRTGEPNL